MSADTLITYAGWLGTAGAVGFAFYQNFKNGKNQESQRVTDAKDDLVKSLTADRDAWKSQLEATAQGYANYRETTHKSVQDLQAKVLTMTEEVARLRSATDITPLLADRKAQTEINTKILSSLDMIMEHLCALKPAAKGRKAKKTMTP